MIRKMAFVISCFMSLTIYSQENILDAYIDKALKNNITLQQKEYSYQKSLEALKESKRMFLPTVSAEASFTRAEGGRTIDFPVGEMMNPVYSNLDAVNQTLHQTIPDYPEVSTYPEIEDYSISLIRETEQETKLQVSMPLFNAIIIQNHKISKGLADVESINVDIYKRELVEEVKTAYYQFLKADKAMFLYNNSLKIVEQNLKARQSLYDNEKITIDELYAAKAQVSEMEKNIADATKQQIMAKAWFNFLLNVELDSEIQISTELDFSPCLITLEESKSMSATYREELSQMDKYIEIQDNKVKMEQGQYLPKISAGAQYGFQGTDYSFTSDYDLALVGVTLKWNLFTSGQQKSKVNQARYERQITESKKQEIELQIQMDVMDSWYSVQTAQKSIDLAQQELQNYDKSYKLVEKKYQQGMANYFEYSNALNNKINAENKLIISRYDYLIEQAKLERKVSDYQFK